MIHTSLAGRRFRTKVFEENGKWWFKWWNVSDLGQSPGFPLAQGIKGPFRDEAEAMRARQAFENDETNKSQSAIFEPE